METDKPLIAILMAVYEPNMEWLREQLLSLNRQTYPNLCLYICDDASPTVRFNEIQSCVQNCISKFPVKLSRNETNLGSTKTFERLTQIAEGEYFAYCDQDDIWLDHKLETLEQELKEHHAGLVCSDVIVIDENGAQIANSITKVRRRHRFKSGTGLANGLIYRNFVIGCTTLMRSSLAKEAIPFIPCMVHDHYLAFYCAMTHVICTIEKPLIKYRIHQYNQTNVLAGVTEKETYYQKRILIFYDRVLALRERFPDWDTTLAWKWAQARIAYYQGEKGAFQRLFKLRKVNNVTTFFELIMIKMPRGVFHFVLQIIKRGVL
jgi:glycosyltransferase involved in cell wall biosynthesis